MEFTEHSIQSKLYSRCLYQLKHRIAIPNCYLFDWESDFLSMTQSRRLFEFEIKVTKADYQRDAQKYRAERFKSGHYGANYFVYVVPLNMIKLEEVPSYAGLWQIDKYANILELKKPPLLHRNKCTEHHFEKFAVSLTHRYYQARKSNAG